MGYKIILISKFSEPWNNGWYYKTGLEKNGHTVLPFDHTLGPDAEKSIIGRTIREKPDFVLHLKKELPSYVFNELRGYTKVIQWYQDPVIPEWLPPYVKACDIFFTMSEGLVGEFRKLNPHVYWLTQGFEPSFFEVNSITDADRRRYGADVTFVGNLGSKPQYRIRRDYLQRIIKERFNFKWWGPRLPRKLLTIPLIVSKLGRSYGGRFIWGEEYAKVARLSKVFIASMSARMYTAVGCGAFYMCRHVDGIEEILEPGREIVTFRSEGEMIDMIRYYLENDDLRMRIAAAGKKRVMKEHTYEARIRQMLRIIENAT
jgi:glycosyltransferase involved in cell wall biosynthesis